MRPLFLAFCSFFALAHALCPAGSECDLESKPVRTCSPGEYSIEGQMSCYRCPKGKANFFLLFKGINVQ